MLDVVLAAGALLLLPTGWSKIRHPAFTVRALRAIMWPASRLAVRLLGLGEIAAGVWLLVTWSPLPAVLLAALYSGFTLWLVVALRARVPIESCGCSARPDTPPTRLHAAITATVAVAAAVSAAIGLEPVWRNQDVLATMSAMVGAASLATLSYLTITDGALLRGALDL